MKLRLLGLGKDQRDPSIQTPGGPPPVFDKYQRYEGRDCPSEALTMVGMKRLENIQALYQEIQRNGTSGDLLEAGVWRGGATIFMRALLKDADDKRRCVWVADSFQGLPEPVSEVDNRKWNDGFEWYLQVPQDQVAANFAFYDLLDEQVKFLPGWFSETLPNCEVQLLALMRVDCDMHDSTMVVLEHLYPKLAPDGFVIIDDYLSSPPCREAVTEYRTNKGIEAPIHVVDWAGVWWQK